MAVAAAKAADDLEAVLAEAAEFVSSDHERAIASSRDIYSGPTKELLPESLRDAAPGDTVCDVCGVSLLVFRYFMVVYGSDAAVGASQLCSLPPLISHTRTPVLLESTLCALPLQ
jgi:hypothetical protein